MKSSQSSQRCLDVRNISLSGSRFARVQLHGNNAFYGFLLRVCALAYEALLPEPATGRFRFRDVISDPQTMGLVFQDFIFNFFRLEQNEFAVKSDQSVGLWIPPLDSDTA